MTIRKRTQESKVETTMDLNASRGEEVRIACTVCNNETKHTVVSSVEVTEDVDDGQIRGWTTYQILQCLGCETFAFRKNHRNTEDFYVVYKNTFSLDADNYYDEFGEAFLTEYEEVYPPRLAGRPKLKDEYLLPNGVGYIYDEAHRALVSEMPILAAVGVRALVEAICHEENAPGKNLKEKVDGLVRLGVLTRSGAGILQKLRLLGNESAHEIKRHDLWKLGIAFDVAEHVLQAVYLLPEQADRLK